MLHEKIILVTGASRGIGRAVAKKLAQKHATVILLSRTTKDLESLYDEISQAGHPKPSICPFNLCTATLNDYDELRQNILNQYSRLDGLIHIAGILGELAPIATYNVQQWYQVLQVNLNAQFLLTQACLELLKLSPASSIIFTFNKTLDIPKAYWGAYAVAQKGSQALMEMLKLECENTSNIQVKTVKLDKINTNLRRQAYPAEQIVDLISPEEIASNYISSYT